MSHNEALVAVLRCVILANIAAIESSVILPELYREFRELQGQPARPKGTRPLVAPPGFVPPATGTPGSGPN